MRSTFTLQRLLSSNVGSSGPSLRRMLLSTSTSSSTSSTPSPSPSNSERANNKGGSREDKASRPASANRPFSLPPGKFRPKQSLGQNFLSDQNYVNKIVEAMPPDQSAQGHR